MSWGQKTDPVSGLKYEVSNGKVYIVGIGTSPSDVVVPEEIEGYPVKVLGAFCFAPTGEGAQLTSVKLPSSLEEIRENVFNYTLLSEITIPASVTKISQRAFGACNSLRTVTFESTGDISDYSSNMFTGWSGSTPPDVIYVPKGMKEAYSAQLPKYANIIQEKEMTPTGIQKPATDPSTKKHSAAIYSLDGKLVSKDGSTTGIAKGIYIQNGKKVVMK